jgi:hypothetical protein
MVVADGTFFKGAPETANRTSADAKLLLGMKIFPHVFTDG